MARTLYKIAQGESVFFFPPKLKKVKKHDSD